MWNRVRSLSGNIADLGHPLPLRRVLEKYVWPFPAGEPFQGTEHITSPAQEGYLKRLIPLSDHMAAWQLLSNVSPWVLWTVEWGLWNQFGNCPRFNGVLPTLVVLEQEPDTLSWRAEVQGMETFTQRAESIWQRFRKAEVDLFALGNSTHCPLWGAFLKANYGCKFRCYQ